MPTPIAALTCTFSAGLSSASHKTSQALGQRADQLEDPLRVGIVVGLEPLEQRESTLALRGREDPVDRLRDVGIAA